MSPGMSPGSSCDVHASSSSTSSSQSDPTVDTPPADSRPVRRRCELPSPWPRPLLLTLAAPILPRGLCNGDTDTCRAGDPGGEIHSARAGRPEASDGCSVRSGRNARDGVKGSRGSCVAVALPEPTWSSACVAEFAIASCVPACLSVPHDVLDGPPSLAFRVGLAAGRAYRTTSPGCSMTVEQMGA